MRCISPLKIKNPKYGSSPEEPFFIEVGCNKCYNCLQNRRREWFLRLCYEYDNNNYTYFVTLTYDNDHIGDGMLHKDHLQKWLKALKRKYGCRWYAIGEYGTHTFRPHYHAILFSQLPIDDPIWDKGNYLFENCQSTAQINYILHYHTRPKLPDYFDNDDAQPAFSLMSKGLGVGLMTSELVDYLLNHNSCTIKYNGDTFVFPRYYQKKFGISSYNPDITSSREQFNDQYGRKFSDSEYSRMKLGEKRLSDKRKRIINNQIKNV